MMMVVLLCQCEKEPTLIDIPDGSFLNALINLGADTDGDGRISPAEAEVITYLDISKKNISDLKGIEAFINVDTLLCYRNQLTTLDVSNNVELNWLSCCPDQLTTLDVSGNTSLEYLFCFDNRLSGLDVSSNVALIRLDCSQNQITTLDISQNTSLEQLYITDMPSLNLVCVWTLPFPPSGLITYTTGSPNISYTGSCGK